MRFLVFTLYAPLGSFGEVAVGERRMSWARPGRSAILGLIAAAQGIERTDEAGHQRLECDLHYAVRTDATGRPFLDYHTAQTPKARRGQAFDTRREELATDDLHTVLSSREWRSDASFTVMLWLRRNGSLDLDKIADALRRPKFMLYLGRKSAPLGLPLNPRVVVADTFLDAFAAQEPDDEEEAVLACIRDDASRQGHIAFDHDAPGAPEALLERRRDAVVSRARWQFADRLERIVLRDGGRV